MGYIVPIRTLAAIALLLLVLTFITVWVADMDFGKINIWIALSIAVLKGSLVVLFFMHLKYDRPFNGIIFVMALGLVALFISFALTDTREYAPDVDTGNAREVVTQLGDIAEQP